MKNYFITATDTDAGKTFIACALASALSEHGRVLGFKPISAGCEVINNELVNEDAYLLAKYCNANQKITEVNPIAFEEPIAPHIAALNTGQVITAAQINDFYQKLVKQKPDYLICEGAGGWRLPLGNGEFLSDFAMQSKQNVILIVNVKLGCLNHARLTFESIRDDGLNIVGWVGNVIDEMLYQKENLAQLHELIDAPCLGVVPKCESIEHAIRFIDLGLVT